MVKRKTRKAPKPHSLKVTLHRTISPGHGGVGVRRHSYLPRRAGVTRMSYLPIRRGSKRRTYGIKPLARALPPAAKTFRLRKHKAKLAKATPARHAAARRAVRHHRTTVKRRVLRVRRTTHRRRRVRARRR